MTIHFGKGRKGTSLMLLKNLPGQADKQSGEADEYHLINSPGSP